MEGIAVVGSGPLHRRAARIVAQLTASAAASTEGHVLDPRAVVVAGRVPHAAALMRRSLDEGAGVLVLDPSALGELDTGVLRRLAALARRRAATFQVARPRLRAHTVQLLRAQFRQQTGAPQPATLVAALSVAPEADPGDVMALAEEALLIMVDLIGVMPNTVTALQSDFVAFEDPAPAVASAIFPNGEIGQVSVSIAKALPSFHLRIITPDTTTEIDLAQPQAPLRVEEVTADGVRLHTFPPAGDEDDRDDVLRDIIQQFWQVNISGAGPTVELGMELVAARLREALLTSAEHSGQPYDLGGAKTPASPELRVIEGGGHSIDIPRPALRLVEVTQ